MAISLVGVGAFSEVSTTAVSIALPANTQPGDLVLLLVAAGGDSPATTDSASSPNGIPFGFQRRGNELFIDYGAGGAYQSVYWGFVGSPTQTSVIVQLTCETGTGGGIWAAASAWRGVDQSNPFAGAQSPDVSQGTGAAATTITPETVSTAIPGCMVVSFATSSDNNALGLSAGSEQGFTLSSISGTGYDSTVGSDGALGMAYRVAPEAGSVTMPTWEQTTGGPDTWNWQTLVLRPTTSFGDAQVSEAADVVVSSGAVTSGIEGSGQLVEGADSLIGQSQAWFARSVGRLSRLQQIGIGGKDYPGFTSKEPPAAVTGDGSLVEAGDSLSAAGEVAVSASGALAEAADTLQASGAVAIAAAGELREAADSLLGEGSAGALGVGNLLEQNDVVAASGTVAVSGTGQLLEVADALQAAGAVVISAAGQLIEAADTLLAAGAGEVQRAIGRVGRLAQFGIGARDYVGFAPKGAAPSTITGAGHLIEGVDTATAQGEVAVVGTSQALEANDTTQAAGEVAVAGAGLLTEADDHLQGEGSGAVLGAGALREQADATQASGSVAVTGVGSLIEAADQTLAAASVAVQGVGALLEAADHLLGEGGGPVSRKGRLAQFGIGTRDYVGFSAKVGGEGPRTGSGTLLEQPDQTSGVGEVTGGTGPHDPGHITRLGQMGVPWPLQTFSAKSGSVEGFGTLREVSDLVQAAGAVAVAGAGFLVEVADALQGAGAAQVAGAGLLNEADDRIDATGGTASFGSAQLNEADDSVASSGAVAVSGSGYLPEQDDRVQSSGVVEVAGTGYLAEQPDTLGATGTAPAGSVGSANLLEQADVVSSSGAVAISGAAQVLEQADIVLGAGTVSVSGSGSLSEAADYLDGVGITASIIGEGILREAGDTISGHAVLRATPARVRGSDRKRAGGVGSTRGAGVVGSTRGRGGVTSSEGP